MRAGSGAKFLAMLTVNHYIYMYALKLVAPEASRRKCARGGGREQS